MAVAAVLGTPAVGGAVPGAPATQAQADQAEAIILEGVERRRAKDDAGALALFRKAHALAPTPRAAAQMGLAEQALERWLDADRHLSEALRATSDPWIAKHRRVLEESLRTVAAKVGHLEVGGAPSGAEVKINGEPSGPLPILEPVPVPPGPVHIDVSKTGFLRSTLSITVAMGQRSRVDVRLQPDPAVIKVPDDEADPPAPPSSALRTARWVGVGAAGLFLAAGITGAVVHDRKIGQFNDAGCMRDPVTGAIRAGNATTCQPLIDTASTGKTAAVVGFAGAGLLALTSAILFFAF